MLIVVSGAIVNKRADMMAFGWRDDETDLIMHVRKDGAEGAKEKENWQGNGFRYRPNWA